MWTCPALISNCIIHQILPRFKHSRRNETAGKGQQYLPHYICYSCKINTHFDYINSVFLCLLIRLARYNLSTGTVILTWKQFSKLFCMFQLVLLLHLHTIRTLFKSFKESRGKKLIYLYLCPCFIFSGSRLSVLSPLSIMIPE